MKNSSFLLLGLLFSAVASAQTIRVDRVKGTKAIVEIVSGSMKAGQSYNFTTGDLEELSDAKGHTGSPGKHGNVIGLSGSLKSLSRSSGGASTSTSYFGVSGRYGWNHIANEYGFLGEFTSTNETGPNTTLFMGGGFYDFNLVPHKSSTEMVYGFGGEGGLGSYNNGTTSSMFWSIYPSGFLKWFLFKTTTCVRGDIGLFYRSMQSSPAVTESGLEAKLGLAHYF